MRLTPTSRSRGGSVAILMATPSEAGAPRPPRRWPRRLLIGANVFVALCIVATATGYGYARYKYDRVPTIPGLGALLPGDEPEEDPAAARVLNVLMVGSDSREGLSKEEQKKYNDRRNPVSGQRSDTMIILHVDPRQEKAAMLSIPRDLWVTIAGTKRKDRINTAFQGEDGPRRLIETIETELNIPIDHYLQVDFSGFQGLVKAVGGVKVYFPGPARDRVAGLNIPKGGCVELDGAQALAYVRSRQYQYFESGKWRSDPTGDLGRIERQQDFIRRVMKKAVSLGWTRPDKVPGVINNLVKNVKKDEYLDFDDAVSLARRFKSLDPAKVEMLSLPVYDTNHGGAAALDLKQPDAEAIIARFNGTLTQGPGAGDPSLPKPATMVVPNTVRVRVLNGSGVGGRATEITTQLRQSGFNTTTPGDADSFKYIRSVVTYAPGQRDKALFLASLMKKTPQLREDRTLKGLDLHLVVGSDWGGLNAKAGAGATATSTSTTAKAGAKATTTTAPVSKASPADSC